MAQLRPQDGCLKPASVTECRVVVSARAGLQGAGPHTLAGALSFPLLPGLPMSADVLALSHLQTLPEATRPLFLAEWSRRKKDKGIALGLNCLSLAGFAGIGRIYIGQVGMGVALLLLSPLTCGVWGLVDIFLVGSAAETENTKILAELQAAFPAQR